MKRRHAAPRGPGWSPNFANDRDALARLMEAEAGGEGDAGKLAVANVVRNRADSNYSGYGKDITSQVRAPLQFSAFNKYGSVNATGKRTMAMPADSPTMRHNYELADQVLARMSPDPTHGANQYYAPQGMPGHRAPKWWNNDYKTAEIGHQRFQSNPNSPVTPDVGHSMPGDKSMLAGDMSNAVAPNSRYAAMASIAPRAETPERQMARTAAPERNRMAALEHAVQPQQPISSANFLTHRAEAAPAQHSQPMADTPILQEPQQAGAPAAEGMAMNALPASGVPMMAQPMMQPEMMGMQGGLPDMMANATMPPQMADMSGGMDFGGFDLGGLFG